MRWLYDWGGLNAWLFLHINHLRAPFYDEFLLVVSWLADHHNLKYYIVLVALFLFGRLLVDKMRHIPVTRDDIKTAAAPPLAMLIGYTAFGLIINLCKTAFALPRPFVQYYYTPGMVRFVGAYPPVEDYYTSLPSGHAATAAFMLTVLWPLMNRTSRKIGIGLVALVCWSRVSIGMHFPADVLAGALIGTGVGYVVRRYVFRMLAVKA